MSINNLLPNFKLGPLDKYRKLASFDWKDMKLSLETIEEIKYYNEIIEKLKTIQRTDITNADNTLNKIRHVSAKRVKILNQLNINNTDLDISDIIKPMVITRITIQWDTSSITKYMMSAGLCLEVLRRLGTKRHELYINDTKNWKAIGCFCLTEISHGTNLKGLRTTATYDSVRGKFVLNTPDFEAAKCWSGNLGQSATYAIIYAKLFTPDAKYHGLHAFVVDIRDPKTLNPYNGVIIGDMGAKSGLNGVDNGFVLFQNYHIPRESLLNKTGDVTREGKYVSTLESSKKFGASLGTLSSGRTTIIQNSAAFMEKALTTAIRYSAVRTKNQIPIIEYQAQQWRLLPYLAGCYVLKNFAKYFGAINNKFIIDSTEQIKNDEYLSKLGIEIHAVSSAGKSLSTWLVRDAIQECREACGGYGYLKVCELTDLRNDHEASCTYEGESNVLCQQTSNWLMKLWTLVQKSQFIPETPLNSVYYLNDANNIYKSKLYINSVEEIIDCNNILRMYKWLVVFLLKESCQKFQNLSKKGMNAFTAKNNTQIFFMHTLSIVFIKHLMIEKMYQFIETVQNDSLKNVLTKLLSLYGLWSLENHTNIFYQGDFASNSNIDSYIKEGILQLCGQLKNDAIALIDAIAPDDFLINSPLGKSDGQVYRHLQEAFATSSRSLNKCQQELIDYTINNINSKL